MNRLARLSTRSLGLLALPIAGFLSAPAALADDAFWPNWRGPLLNGSSEATGLPLKWSETENVKWRTELPWWSGSTPVVWGDRIFLTSPEKAEPGNEAPRDDGPHAPGGNGLLLLCLNRADGGILWTVKLGEGNRLKRKHNMASPSPVTDGAHVWVVTGQGQFVCLDFDGKEVWRRDIQKDYGTFGQMWGFASSPLLLSDRLILPVMHGWETDDPSYLLAVEKATGKTIWKTERPNEAIKESPDSYITPGLARLPGHDEVIVNAGDVVTGHDAKSGAELWRVRGINPTNSEWYRIIASPVVVGDLVLAPSRRNPLTAIRAGGKGDVTDTHKLWSYKAGPDVPTPVSDGRHVWVVDDDGRFTCLDAANGEPFYKPERIAQGTYSSSLLLADGKVYATSESGVTTVLEASKEFKVLAENSLNDEYTLSTPVVAGRNLLIRTSAYLYCIGE